jgi:hypothetical protein
MNRNRQATESMTKNTSRFERVTDSVASQAVQGSQAAGAAVDHARDISAIWAGRVAGSTVRQAHKNRPRHGRSIAKAGVIGLGSAAVLGVTGFLAAPAVGAAIGSAAGLSGAAAVSHGLAILGGGALSAGGAGMAGGMWTVTGAGAATGLLTAGGGTALHEIGAATAGRSAAGH